MSTAATVTRPTTSLITDQIIRLVPVDRITPAKDNPRRDVGDVTELAASIKAVGILEPLVVTPRPQAVMDTKTGPVVLREADFLLVIGHRRLAAARQAGLKEVPAIVRNFDEKARLEAMLIENLQRTDLAPIEEGRAFKQLLGLGHSQRELGDRLGRSQSHISKRLSLLELPEVAIKELDSGGITLADAVELTKLAKYPDEIAQAIKEPRYYGGIPNIVAQRLERRASGERADATRARLQKVGVELLKDVESEWQVPTGTVALGSGWNHLDMPAHEHKKFPCHRATVVRSTGSALYLCSDPKSHLKGPDKAKLARNLPTRDTSFAKQRAKEAEQRRQFQATAEARGKVIATALKGRIPKTAADHILGQLIRGADPDGIEGACVLLGLTKDRRRGGPDGRKLLDAYMAKGADNHWRAALAVAFAVAEFELSDDGYGVAPGVLGPHFEYLKKLGYAPSPVELKAAKDSLR